MDAALIHRQAGGFQRHIGLIHGDELSKGANPVVARTGVDLIPCLEAAHIPADAHNGSGQIVAKDERRLVGQEQLELAVPDLAVQKVDRGGLNAHQNIIRANLRFRHVGQTERALLLVFVDDKGFHGVSPI